MVFAEDVRSKWDRISDIESEISSLKDKDRLKELEEERQICTDYIIDYGKTDLIEQRFKIIKRVLQDNGYNDDYIMNFEWWDTKVDPSDILTFINRCIFKDIDKKKLN